MSAEAVTVVLHHSKSEGTAKLVLWGIANHHSDAGAWPSIATLAKYANVKERRVQQIIRELALLGEISIEEQGGLGQRQYKTNRYHILIQCPSDCDGSLQHKTGVQAVTDRGAIWGTSGVQPTAPEPNKELNKNLSGDTKALFDEFWKEYPKAPQHRTERKSDAFREFKSALTRAKFEEILAGVIAYANDPKENRYKLIAVKWLRNDGWELASAPNPDTVRATVRREKEKVAADKYLAELKEREKLAAPPPKCEHGKNPALCLPCSKSLG